MRVGRGESSGQGPDLRQGQLTCSAAARWRICAVGALGIMPYISASIIMQLDDGRGARAGAPGARRRHGPPEDHPVHPLPHLALCIVQGYALAARMLNPEAFGIQQADRAVPRAWVPIMAVITMTTGTMLLMWLGEQITERGIGNGISLIITISIISRLPGAIQAIAYQHVPPVEGGAARNSPSSTWSAAASCSSWSSPGWSP
jgi:preprotein translocase subunit SecY